MREIARVRSYRVLEEMVKYLDFLKFLKFFLFSMPQIYCLDPVTTKKVNRITDKIRNCLKGNNNNNNITTNFY